MNDDALLKRLKDLEDVNAIQSSEPSVADDEYMRGLANGLILATATMHGESPVYFNPDGKLEKKLKEAEITMDAPPAADADQAEKEAWFEQRTQGHIQRVKDAITKIVKAYPELSALSARGEQHDANKLLEPERGPYIKLTWQHKMDNWNGYKTPGTMEDPEIAQATLHHIVNSPHHPEFWNKEEANIDPKDRDKSKHAISAEKMPDIDVAEMVADWQAMAEELQKNTAREWFNKQKNVRWKFSPHQEELIDKLLKVFENG